MALKALMHHVLIQRLDYWMNTGWSDEYRVRYRKDVSSTDNGEYIRFAYKGSHICFTLIYYFSPSYHRRISSHSPERFVLKEL